LAAGVVLWRDSGRGREVALVHRPKYNDWSLPKGKTEAGEPLWATAVRETAEETGHAVTLGRPLSVQEYSVNDRPKLVHYWSGRAGVGRFTPHAEVDDLRWLSVAEAARTLTWSRDADLLQEWAADADSTPLLLVRHARAVRRGDWDGPDDLRPLNDEGRRQAQALTGLLRAYGVTRAVSSDAERCLRTFTPFCDQARVTLEVEPALSETAFERHPEAAAVRIQALAASGTPTAVCTHRPLFGSLVTALGVTAGGLDVAATHVVHLADGIPVAVETHPAPEQAPLGSMAR
jgi:8-oxo-dGTP diphosphatase